MTEDGTSVPFDASSPPSAYMACLPKTGRTRLLIRYDFDNEDAESGATGAVTAGDYAALATFDTDVHYGGSSSTLAVYDLRTGNVTSNLGGETAGCDGYSCETTMDDLAINTQGFTAAHTVTTDGCQNPSGCEAIQVSDSTGPRTVDTAIPGIGSPALTDVALSGDTVTWKHTGIAESAQLH